MPNPNSSVGQLLTTTLDNYAPSIIDNITNNHPLLEKLKAKGNIVKKSGGVTFQEKISYATNGTVSEWRWLGIPNDRPLYNLHLIKQNPDAIIVLVEGEKTADAGQSNFEPSKIFTPVSIRLIFGTDGDVSDDGVMKHFNS